MGRSWIVVLALLGAAVSASTPGDKAVPAAAPDLRAQALKMKPGTIGLSRQNYSKAVWAVLMDVGLDGGGAYTLLVVGDGSVSLYFSSGGGIIGAGAHDPIRAAGEALLVEAGKHLAGNTGKVSDDLPRTGDVKFHLRTFDRTYTFAATEKALGGGDHLLSPLFDAAHAVITQIRLQQEQDQAAGGEARTTSLSR